MNYLQKYQSVLGLDPDGKLGPKTAAAMMVDLGITDKLYFAHMIGQVAHESGGFIHDRESMNYSAQGLANTWSKYSSTGVRGGPYNSLAKRLERKPEAIANNVYGSRDDLGNRGEASGDGWKYRGIFGLQLTGRDNIQEFIHSLGLPIETDPESLLSDPKHYFLAGDFWFKHNGVDKLCKSTSRDCIVAVTKRVNGGTNGLADRIAQTQKVFKALGLV